MPQIVPLLAAVKGAAKSQISLTVLARSGGNEAVAAMAYRLNETICQ